MTGTVWVSSDVMPDGSYAVTVNFTEDDAMRLDRDGAIRYAMGCLAAARAAEYDALILKQMEDIHPDSDRDVACVIRAFREQREPVPGTGTDFSLEPGISSQTREGFVIVRLGGRVLGQWDVASLRDHAAGVLEATIIVELDTAYYRVLRDVIDVPEPTARAVIGALYELRGTD